MSEQFFKTPNYRALQGGWDSFEVSNSLRRSGIADKLKQQLFYPYVEDDSRRTRAVIERQLEPSECNGIAVAIEQHVSPFFRIGRQFHKFAVVALGGVVTRSPNNSQEKIVFLEFASVGDVSRFGLPSAINVIADNNCEPLPLEVFSPPVGIIARHNNTGLKTEFLYSSKAYEIACQHLDEVATEVEIWRLGSPFTAFNQLTERSALLASILNKIELQVRRDTPNAFILAIEHLGFLSSDQLELGVYVGRSIPNELIQSPQSMQLNIHEFKIDSDRGINGVFEFEARELWCEKVTNISDESLRQASHIWMLKNRKIAHHFGIARTAEAFSPQQQREEGDSKLKRLFD